MLARAFLLLVVFQLGACASTLRPEEAAAIEGRTYVVTGASSGFGRGVALKLAQLRANVVLAARRTGLLEEVAAEARKHGAQALVVTTDVADPRAMQRLAAATLEKFGRIDAWINNAGVAAIGPFWDIPAEDHARIVDVNLKGTVYGSREALRQFTRQGHGTLVNVGSVESEVPVAYHASYAASKAGVLNLGRALNEELRLAGHERIKVSTVMPWAADTPLWEHVGNYSGGTPRMPWMDGPEITVDAIVRASLYPEEEVPAGWKARGARVAHGIAPDATEHITGNIAHRWQIETAPPAPPTAGNLHEPVHEGGTVTGTSRQRMRMEDGASTGATR
ncbi:MAG TPA: SDR family NAD(P)-dependent oxidoreductase [Burkholderiales bacterium]|nr:SDR family NAD(P)-dependent oxidoreductase [Burkholderiales bacterium]